MVFQWFSYGFLTFFHMFPSSNPLDDTPIHWGSAKLELLDDTLEASGTMAILPKLMSFIWWFNGI